MSQNPLLHPPDPPAAGGFGHRQALLLARLAPPPPAHGALFRWLVEGRQIRRASDDVGPHRLVPRPPTSFDALAIHGWDASVPALVAAGWAS